ncbi:MAG: hypothetical protein M3137_20885 [Actinomycetota bacterium]|nr:hypothetical protein [Actinomycetota bacterium]
MTEPDSQEPSAPDALGSPDDDRSGTTVDEGIARAEVGSEVEGFHTAPEEGDTGESRRAEIRDVEGATEGTVDRNPGEATPPEPGLSPTKTGSGGAQNIAGARISDRMAGKQPLPDEPPFDGDTETKP